MANANDSLPRCFDCRFYSPGDYGCPMDEEESQIPKDGDDCLPGVCRRHPPLLGELVVNERDKEPWRTYGEWPKVMACDWCGEFQRRERPLPCRSWTEADVRQGQT